MLAGFVIATAATTAQASALRCASNYAVAYNGGVMICTGNPGNDCDTPED